MTEIITDPRFIVEADEKSIVCTLFDRIKNEDRLSDIFLILEDLICLRFNDYSIFRKIQHNINSVLNSNY